MGVIKMKCKKKSFKRTDLINLWKLVNNVFEESKLKERKGSRKL